MYGDKRPLSHQRFEIGPHHRYLLPPGAISDQGQLFLTLGPKIISGQVIGHTALDEGTGAVRNGMEKRIRYVRMMGEGADGHFLSALTIAPAGPGSGRAREYGPCAERTFLRRKGYIGRSICTGGRNALRSSCHGDVSYFIYRCNLVVTR